MSTAWFSTAGITHSVLVRLDRAVRLPDGAWVRGRGLRDPAPGGPVPEYGLYLGSAALRRRHTIPWPHTWVDWPDFLLPRDSRLAAQLIPTCTGAPRTVSASRSLAGGGVGRTGAVLASLAVLAGDAVAWTWAQYHPRAVEMPWQRRWVTRSRVLDPA